MMKKAFQFMSLLFGLFVFSACSFSNDDEKEEQENLEIPVTFIALSEPDFSLYEGDGKLITATVKPDNATNKGLRWFSSSPNVAKVTDGYVEAISKGETRIIASTENGQVQNALIVNVRSPVDDVLAKLKSFQAVGSGWGNYDYFEFEVSNTTSESITITGISVTNEGTHKTVAIDDNFLPLKISEQRFQRVYIYDEISASARLGVVLTFHFHGKEYVCNKFYVN